MNEWVELETYIELLTQAVMEENVDLLRELTQKLNIKNVS